jgi:hypothetical protein
MSELLDAFRREAWRFEDFRRKVGELRRVMEFGERLKAEIWSLLRKTEVDRLLEEMEPVFALIYAEPRRVETLALLRNPTLKRLLELAEHLEAPESPVPSRPLDLEVELPLSEGLKRVRIRRLVLAEGKLRLEYVLGTNRWEREIETFSDFTLLLPVYPQVMEFLEEVTTQYRSYLSELEELKGRVISGTPRKCWPTTYEGVRTTER